MPETPQTVAVAKASLSSCIMVGWMASNNDNSDPNSIWRSNACNLHSATVEVNNLLFVLYLVIMSASINKNVNVERRTWDKETYEKRAQSRLAAENDEGSSSTPQISDAANNDIESDAAKALKNEIDPTEEKEEFVPAKQGRAGPE